MTLISYKVNTKNDYENSLLLPASDCLCIEMALSSGEHVRVRVVVNKEYCFDNQWNTTLQKKSMKPKKFKQGFQTKENGLKEKEFVEFLRIYPEFRRLPWPNFKAYY